MPTMQEIVDIDPAWESDVLTVLQYWKWIRDGSAQKLLGALNSTYKGG